MKTLQKSKPWWNPNLSEAYKELRDAWDILHGWMRDFHTPSIALVERVKEKHNLTLRLVRKAKNKYYCKMVEANAQNIWTYQKWTTSTRTYTAQMIERDNQPLAISHADKCNALRAQLFPEPPLNLNPRVEDMPHFVVTRRVGSTKQGNLPPTKTLHQLRVPPIEMEDVNCSGPTETEPRLLKTQIIQTRPTPRSIRKSIGKDTGMETGILHS